MVIPMSFEMVIPKLTGSSWPTQTVTPTGLNWLIRTETPMETPMDFRSDFLKGFLKPTDLDWRFRTGSHLDFLKDFQTGFRSAILIGSQTDFRSAILMDFRMDSRSAILMEQNPLPL
jgi:hypothetical protein